MFLPSSIPPPSYLSASQSSLPFFSQASSPTWCHSTLRASSAIPLLPQAVLVRPVISSAFTETLPTQLLIPNFPSSTPLTWFHSSCHYRTSMGTAKPLSVFLGPNSSLFIWTGHPHHSSVVEQARPVVLWRWYTRPNNKKGTIRLVQVESLHVFTY